MKPLKYQKEFEAIHRKYRQAETKVQNQKKKYEELVKEKGNIRNKLSEYDLSAKNIDKYETQMDEVLDKIRGAKKELKQANKELEEVKQERAEVKEKYGKQFYQFCDKRVSEIRDHLNSIKQLNDEIEAAGDRAFKLGNMYIPSLNPSFFNKIKQPKKILANGKREYEV